MAEMIDIYDANLVKIGQMERVDAHLQAQWHATFHLWLISPADRGYVLYQLRSPTAKNFPNMLDITAAGHLLAGETVEDGVREVKEELGVDLPFSAVVSLGWRIEVADQANGQRNREHQAVHMATITGDLDSFEPDPAEVYGIVRVPIAEGLKLHLGLLETLQCDALVFQTTSRTWNRATETINASRFLQRIQPYYRTVHIMAERMLQKLPLSI